MDRYLIRYFLAVVDHGSFSRAAVGCNVTQPTLSAGIAKLERALDAALFRRSSQRVELTAAGNRFLAHARAIEREFARAQQAMGGVARGAPLRVGVIDTVPARVAADAVAACPAGGGTLYELVFGGERDLAGRLARGRLDAALMPVRDDGQPVLEEGYGVAMAAGHRLAALPVVEAQALRDEAMIVRRHCEALAETSRHFVERGVRPHFAMRSTSDEQVARMVAAGLGVTIMPECHRSPAIRVVPLAGFAARRTLGFRYAAASGHMRTAPPPLLTALADALT